MKFLPGTPVQAIDGRHALNRMYLKTGSALLLIVALGQARAADTNPAATSPRIPRMTFRSISLMPWSKQ